MKSDIDYTLYLVTDRDLMSTDTLEQAVGDAIAGGCTLVQLREKTACSLDFYKTALAVRAITAKHHVPLIINDRLDIALAIDADGVHIGQSDLPASVVRRLIGREKLLGVSASTYEEALQAVKDGADYLGIGAMYPTGTKTDAKMVTLEELAKIRKDVRIPIVVIGGIHPATIPDFAGTGIDGFAVVSAVIAQKDIRQAAQDLLIACKSILGKNEA